MPDNNRNDRYSADDFVDVNSFVSAINMFKAAIGEMDKVFDSTLNNVNDRIRRTGDEATRELNKINKYIDELNDRTGLSGGISRGAARRIEDLRSQYASGQITAREFSNASNRIVNSNKIITTALDNLSGTIRSYFGSFINTFAKAPERYYNAYQTTFTNVAGRMGLGYNQTRETYSLLVNSANSNALNIVDDLVPMLNRAAESGFIGADAVNKAYSDAFDSKVMPWLDTASEAYNNMFANLTDAQLKQYKSMQLQLQTSKEGNRLLQSGVINSLTNDLSPILTNIDFNTGGADKIQGEYLEIMRQLVANKMSPNAAYAYVSNLMKNDRNLYEGITSGNIADVIYSISRSEGKGPLGAAGEMSNLITGYMEGLDGVARDAVISAFSYSGYLEGGWGSTYNKSIIDAVEGYRMLANPDTSIYDDLIENAEEYTTANQRVVNFLENTATKFFGEVITALPYGDVFYNGVISGIGQIINLLGTMAATGVGNILGGIASSARGALSGTRAGAVLSTAGRLGVVSGAAFNIASGGYSLYQGISNGNNLAQLGGSAVQAATGLGAIAAVLAGSTGVGALLVGLGLAAKGVSNALDKTSSMSLEVVDAFKAQKQQVDAMRTAEERKAYAVEMGYITQEEANKYTDAAIKNLLEYETSTAKLKEARQEAQMQYQSNVNDLTKRLKELSSSKDTNTMAEILRSAGASESDVDKFLGGEAGALQILNHRSWGGLFGAKSLLQNLSTNDWQILRTVAGLASPESSNAVGLPYAYNDATIRIHRGERVLTAAENASYTSSITGSNDIVNALYEVASQVISVIREIGSPYNNGINYADRILPSPRVEYDENAIMLRSQIGQLSRAF